MKTLRKVINSLSSLKVAIVLLLLIALSSAIGTIIPQGESSKTYINAYANSPWLGLFNGENLLKMQLDHVYSSYWFLSLLGWLGLALITCSIKRQWPSLEAALKWIDYKEPRRINKLAISQILDIENDAHYIQNSVAILTNRGWAIKEKKNRLAARKGVIGRIGPLLVHLGLILLMVGAVLGASQSQHIEKFLAPGRSIEVVSPDGMKQVDFKLTEFAIERGPAGQAEQFISKMEVNDRLSNELLFKEISVNHPLRYKGITLYQADWSIAAITIQINNSPKLQLPVQRIPELGDQIWGVILPSIKEELEPLLLTVSSEKEPIRIFNQKGDSLGLIRAGGAPKEIYGSSIRAFNILPSSGIILKRDPGVPIVYSSFAIILLGSLLSIISTKQIWIIAQPELGKLHIGGISNRDIAGFLREFPEIIKELNEP